MMADYPRLVFLAAIIRFLRFAVTGAGWNHSSRTLAVLITWAVFAEPS
jgi:hypothetical protein